MSDSVANPDGLRTFFVVWGGQLLSILGTTTTGFALQIWVFIETDSVTNLALVSLAVALPATIISPFAGALVDRSDRRRVMLAADAAAGLATLGFAGLYATDALALWHVYVVVAVGSVANAFQLPAWQASVPVLVPKQHLGRANGLIQFNDALAFVIAPGAAGALLVWSGLGTVLLLDVATFLVAMATLAIVRFPRPKAYAEAETGSVAGDALAGWRFLRERPGLFGLLWTYAGVNFALSFSTILVIPLVLSFASEGEAGAVLSIGGLGAVLGSIVMSAWGGPQRRVRTTMAAIVVAGLGVAAIGLHPSLPWTVTAAFLALATVPVANTTSQVLWQLKVPVAVQGRVFAIRRMIAQAMAPLAMLLAGPLADHVFEPLLATDGALADSVGSIIGTGPGRGIGFMYVVTGLLGSLFGVVGYLLPRVRNLEKELPDYIADDEQA